jgi:hypothetical protein
VRTLRFLPLTFVAGVHGFALFAPYLAVTMAVVHVTWARRRRAIPVPATESMHLPTAMPLPA